MCIRYAFRPRVSSRLTLSGRTFLRKPYAYGGEDSHFPSRYLCRQGHFSTLHQSFRSDFAALRTLLYQYGIPQDSVYSTASVLCLSPVILSAQSRLTSELLRFL
jgi:hypothetical protein